MTQAKKDSLQQAFKGWIYRNHVVVIATLTLSCQIWWNEGKPRYAKVEGFINMAYQDHDNLIALTKADSTHEETHRRYHIYLTGEIDSVKNLIIAER